MLPEYDFRGGIRGKYAKRYQEGANVVVIEPDVAEYFPITNRLTRLSAAWLQ